MGFSFFTSGAATRFCSKDGAAAVLASSNCNTRHVIGMDARPQSGVSQKSSTRSPVLGLGEQAQAVLSERYHKPIL